MRVAILMSCPLAPDLVAKIRAGLQPRQDFLALAEALDARLIAPLKPNRGKPGAMAKLLNFFRPAWAAFRQQRQYDLIISDTERVGLILALLFKFSGTRKRHIVICHGKVVHRYDLGLIRLFNLQRQIQCFVCYGPAVANKLKAALGLSEGQVVTVLHAADQGFWRPLPVATGPLIVSAGMLRRDYPTLIEAVRGQQAALVIAAHSPWVSATGNGIDPATLPPNVRVTRCSYLELRDLYAQAMGVAVPLTMSGAQSGSLVMYEAMAMGKPLLATRTEGQDELAIITEGETGYYVALGDVDGWRARINQLCAQPEVAAAMGRRARQIVESGMNLDGYVADMTAVVQAVASEGQAPQQRHFPANATSPTTLRSSMQGREAEYSTELDR